MQQHSQSSWPSAACHTMTGTNKSIKPTAFVIFSSSNSLCSVHGNTCFSGLTMCCPQSIHSSVKLLWGWDLKLCLWRTEKKGSQQWKG